MSKRKAMSPSMRAHFAGSETRKPIVIKKVAHPQPVKAAAPSKPRAAPPQPPTSSQVQMAHRGSGAAGGTKKQKLGSQQQQADGRH